MKYQGLVILKKIRESFYKWGLVYILFSSLYLLIYLNSSSLYDNNVIYNLLLFKFINTDFIIVLLSIYRISLFIYIVYSLITYEENNSPEFIFLRENKNIFWFKKILSISIFSFIIITIYYLLLLLIFKAKFDLILYLKANFFYIFFFILVRSIAIKFYGIFRVHTYAFFCLFP